jgi:hypothetical protein
MATTTPLRTAERSGTSFADTASRVGRRLKPAAVAAVVGLVLVAPSVVWVSVDRSLWPWDEAYYGSGSIDLWATLRLAPGSWVNAMTHAFVIWPPGIAWIGQFFVPLGGVLGSDRVALLLSTEAAIAVALALLFTAGLRVSNGRRLVALVAPLAAGSAPLIVNLSHWYLVEPFQILAVVWVLLIMASAPKWHLSLTVAQLAAAVSFGLLVKLSTPAYVALPAAVALTLSFLATRDAPGGRWWLDYRFVVSAVLAVVLALGTAAWYRVNFTSAWAHAQLAATSTLWGQKGSFASHLRFWLIQLRDAFFVPFVDLALAAVVLVFAIGYWRRRSSISPPSRHAILLLVGSLGVPAGALVLLADQVNTDPRYIAPAIPGLALALVILVQMIGTTWLAAAVAVVFTAQFALMTLQSFDSRAPSSIVRAAYHSVPQRNATFPDQVSRIVRTACASTPSDQYDTVGTSFAWLNPNTLTMLAAEQFALDGRDCLWAGVQFTSSDPGGWQDFSTRKSTFFVTVDYGNPRNRLPKALDPQTGLSSALDKQINGGNALLLRRAIRSGTYVVVPGSRRLGLVMLRRVGTG